MQGWVNRPDDVRERAFLVYDESTGVGVHVHTFYETDPSNAAEDEAPTQRALELPVALNPGASFAVIEVDPSAVAGSRLPPVDPRTRRIAP